VKTAAQSALPIAFNNHTVVVRSEHPEVMGLLEGIFSMMRPPRSSGHTIVELIVRRQNGCYTVRGNADVILEYGSLVDAVRCVRDSALQLLIDTRPNLLWLHAAAAAFGGRAVLFPGASGGGKSTLVTELCARGWRYLSDEFTPLDPVSHAVLPFALAPAVRQDPGRDMPPEWLQGPKTGVGLRPVSLCRGPTPVAAVVRPTYRRDAQAVLSVSSPAMTALHLLEQCRNLPRLGGRAVAAVSALVRRVPGFSVSFADGEAGADIVARELERRL
jgi:hypothetical protein